jgi:DnaA family protein
MQLPLPVSLPDDETFASFVVGENGHVCELLTALSHALPLWRDDAALSVLNAAQVPLINITGGAGRGKSHLLYAVCHQLAAKQISHIYLDLQEMLAYGPHALDALEHLNLVCLDGLESIGGKPQWQEAVFDLINRVVETRKTVLIFASQHGPQHPKYTLPDLSSRLSAGLTFQLRPLDDHGRQQLIRQRVQQRGLSLSDQALQFLLHHSERDLPSLVALLERLDTRSLQEQKKLSVGMVKRELGL